MPADVLLSALDGRNLLLLDLGRLLDLLRQVTVPGDALDLGHVLVALLERGVVLHLGTFLCTADMGTLGSLRAPETDVAVVGAGKDVAGVGGEADGEDTLHALGVVDITVNPISNSLHPARTA